MTDATPSEVIQIPVREAISEAETPAVIAQGVEFVARPGMVEQLQKAIPEAMGRALSGCKSFSGCMDFVSEQESRLVTVITLWKGPDRAKQSNQYAKRVKMLLTPYVDRWLRTRRLAAFLTLR